jgi:hypothetical protein
MIVPWLTFIAVGLIVYTGFVKLAARILRYTVSWKAGFLFAAVLLVLVIVAHIFSIGQPAAIRIGQGMVLLLCVLIFGSWFFSYRGTKHGGTLLGWAGGLRLIALAVAIMIAVALTIVIPTQLFLNLAPP